MKILFLTRLYWPHVGGVEKHVEKVSKELQKKGHKITIVTTRYDKTLRFHDSIHGNKIIRFNQPKIKYFGLLYTWYWMIKNIDLFKKSDIVHINDVFIWYWPIKILLPFKKVYLTIHGQWGKYPISIGDKLQKKIGVTFSTANLCIGKYIPKNYGIRADALSYGATTILHSNVVKSEDGVLYVGRLDNELPVRIIFKFFEKLKKLKKYKIEILGGGALMDEARKYGNVHGFSDPTPYYKKAKYVFASGYLTILEALANKCLVFATYNNPLQKDYYLLTPFRDFIVLERDSEKLYEKFLYYKKNKKEADKLIRDGYEWAKKQDWASMTDNYSRLWIR